MLLDQQRMKATNILITSAGRRVQLARIFKQTLADLHLSGRVLAAEASRLSAALHACDQAWLVPPCRDPQYVPELLDICQREQVGLVVPTIDPELEVLAAHRQDFQACGTTLAISSPAVVRIGTDKALTHEWLSAHDFPVVRQTVPEKLLAADQSEWPFPLIAKPRYGSASAGVRQITTIGEVEQLARQGGYLVQTVASGREYTIDFLAGRDGQCRCAVPRLRLEVRGGEMSKGMTARQPELIALTHRLCETLPGAYGTLNVQIFRDESTGSLQVIELNPRFGGGFPLAWQAGARFPQWMLEEILGRQVSAVDGQWQDRLVMLRYDEGICLPADRAGVEP